MTRILAEYPFRKITECIFVYRVYISVSHGLPARIPMGSTAPSVSASTKKKNLSRVPYKFIGQTSG